MIIDQRFHIVRKFSLSRSLSRQKYDFNADIKCILPMTSLKQPKMALGVDNTEKESPKHYESFYSEFSRKSMTQHSNRRIKLSMSYKDIKNKKPVQYVIKSKHIRYDEILAFL